MKKAFFLPLTILCTLLITSCQREEFTHDGWDDEPDVADGSLRSMFSVADNRQVYFSKGNLQYSTSGTHISAEDTAYGIFRFAEHQYDYIGEDNALVSATYEGWIDQLCWGSSGWHVEPCSEKDGDYDIESLCGNEAYADWGVYNTISNGGNRPGMWRTLTQEEWDYLVNRRAASTVDGTDSARYVEATVCGMKGLVLLPDIFVRPDDIAPMTGINGNNFGISYNDNIFTAEKWTLMEKAGAVFLPAAGFRGGTWLSTIGEGGSYWASTCNTDRQAYALLFIDGLVNANAVSTYDKDRGYGRSVRLVRNANRVK